MVAKISNFNDVKETFLLIFNGSYPKPERKMVSHYEDMGHSLLHVLEEFIHIVDEMDSIILVPSKLMDVPVTDITNPSNDAFIQNNMDLRGLYSMVKATKTELSLGSKFIKENETYLCPIQNDLCEFFQRIKQLTFIAKYIKANASILVQTSRVQPFTEFEAHSKQKNSPIESVITALKDFIHEISEMEKAVLFPSLLRDCSVEELVKFCKFPMPNEPSNLFDVFDLLKDLKNRLVGNSQANGCFDPKLDQKIIEIWNFFMRYTAMTHELIARYKHEVQCM